MFDLIITRTVQKRAVHAMKSSGLNHGIPNLNKHRSFESGERDCIANVVNLLAHEFTRSRNVHHRKGGTYGSYLPSLQ